MSSASLKLVSPLACLRLCSLCLLSSDSDILQSGLLRAPPSVRRVLFLTFEETDPCLFSKVAAVQTETRIEDSLCRLC